jgi:hypothetical protein
MPALPAKKALPAFHAANDMGRHRSALTIMVGLPPAFAGHRVVAATSTSIWRAKNEGKSFFGLNRALL